MRALTIEDVILRLQKLPPELPVYFSILARYTTSADANIVILELDIPDQLAEEL